jgi:hypothetical protein
MYDSVKNPLIALFTDLESPIKYMYLDINGHVTTGIGFLIDSIDAARKYEWVHIGAAGSEGPRATPEEIAKEWQQVKDQKSKVNLKMGGVNFINHCLRSKPPLIILQLSDKEYDRMSQKCLLTAQGHEASLKARPEGYFRDFDQYPADAQLGVLTYAYCQGPNPRDSKNSKDINYVALGRLCQEQDWGSIVTTRAYSWSSIDGKRAKAFYQLFSNAANVVDAIAQGFDYDTSILYYPIYVSPVQVISAEL